MRAGVHGSDSGKFLVITSAREGRPGLGLRFGLLPGKDYLVIDGGIMNTGHAPMPQHNEQVLGGHAVLAVGYDDSHQWFLVRNSWGTQWGMHGYFTLPYAYLASRDLSDDFWTIRRGELM